MHRCFNRIQVVALVGFLFTGNALAQDTLDEVYTQSIKANTTDAAYSTEWVDHLPASSSVPTPMDYLGYPIGQPGKLTHPDRILAYFEALADASDRIQIIEMGRSHGGRRMIMAAIGDASILARLGEIKDVNHQLADPRRTSKARAKELAASIPATYYITAGLHSTETGPPEMVMELAYRLIVSNAAHIAEIRSKVLTLITPVLEMDGRARTVDWHNRYLQGVTDYQDRPSSSPPYWGDYTFHDNNRDGLQVSQPLTRNYNRAYHEYLPTVSLDLHESVPLLYVSMGTGPYNETISPITVTEWQWMAAYDVSEATKLGLNGVWTWGFYTGWYPGYLLWVTNNHNAVGRFYETFGNSLAGTYERDLKNSSFASERVNSRQWYRPDPPKRKVNWSMRNNTNYMQSGVLASLQLAARNGETLLFNFWQKGANSMQKGKDEAPYAYVVPAKQRDMRALKHALWLLEQHGIEVHKAGAAGEYGKVKLERGDYLVRMDQPYRNFAKTLFSVQRFPADADHTPYDDISWSLPLMLGLESSAIDTLDVQAADMSLVAEPSKEFRVIPSTREFATTYLVENHAQSGFAGMAWACREEAGTKLQVLSREFEGRPAGSLVIEGVPTQRVHELAGQFGVQARLFGMAPEAPLVEVTLPRIGLYHTWRYTQDSGWARYTLEQLGIPFELINKDDLREEGLQDRFDVILVPNTGGDLKAIVHGIDKKWSPMPYTSTPEFPSHGIIDETDDMTGGMGFGGLANLQEFVEQGGTLITLAGAGVLAAESGIARDVSSSPSPGTPGSHVSTKVLRPEHPASFGYGKHPYVFRGNVRLFGVSEYDMGRTVMQFGSKTLAQAELEADRKAGVEPDEDAPEEETKDKDEEGADEIPELCLSGLVPDASALERQAAILDIPVKKGHVLIYGWNPLHRYQNHHDFAYLTNALLFHAQLPGTPTEKEMREREAGDF